MKSTAKRLILFILLSTLPVYAASISGTITGPDGMSPLQDISVTAYFWDGSSWDSIAWAQTDENGYYEVGGLAAGRYRVQFQDWSGDYISEVYDGHKMVSPWNGGTDIILDYGQNRENIDASMSIGSTITGTVTGPDGMTPLQNISINAYRWNGSWWDSVAWAQTDENGEYETNGLVEGNYRVGFHDWQHDTYATQYYDGETDVSMADDVFVEDAGTTTGINVSLLEYASISGYVTKSDGLTPIPDVRITLHNSWRSTHTDSQGAYTINNVDPGSHWLRAEPRSGTPYLAEWYGYALFIPSFGWWTNPPPDEATEIMLVSGENRANIDFMLDKGADLSGAVTGSGMIPLAHSQIQVHNQTYDIARYASTDDRGQYHIAALFPGEHLVKVAADGFRNEWWNNANHKDQAAPAPFDVNQEYQMDFDLQPGQSPAYADVESTPQGALIYLDYQPTQHVTPARINLGEAASHAPRALRRTISVKHDDYPWPFPRDVYPIEAETIDMTFDLAAITMTGSVHVTTEPSGATVFIDYADSPIGVTPLTVGNLEATPASSTHLLLLRKEGYLQPAPIGLFYNQPTNVHVHVELTPAEETDFRADIHSIPPQARLLINYQPTDSVTDLQIGLLDPASHAGSSWWSSAHSVALRRDGYLDSLPRALWFEDTEDPFVLVHLLPDQDYWQTYSDPSQALFEDWAASYGGINVIGGANDDPFSKGMSNQKQMLAGLDPTNSDSRFVLREWRAPETPGEGVRIEWASVPGKRYVVQSTDNLMEPWSIISRIITANDFVTSITDMTAESELGRFYRVIVLP